MLGILASNRHCSTILKYRRYKRPRCSASPKPTPYDYGIRQPANPRWMHTHVSQSIAHDWIETRKLDSDVCVARTLSRTELKCVRISSRSLSLANQARHPASLDIQAITELKPLSAQAAKGKFKIGSKVLRLMGVTASSATHRTSSEPGVCDVRLKTRSGILGALHLDLRPTLWALSRESMLNPAQISSASSSLFSSPPFLPVSAFFTTSSSSELYC